MEITEVKIIPKEGPDKKLRAYATLTFDNCFVVRNVKVIKGNKGLFVAMPSRKMREACPKCNYKNMVRSKFCNQCGSSLPARQTLLPSQMMRGEMNQDQSQRQSEHRDIAHPITLECREYIQKKVLGAYEQEVRKESQAPREEKPKPEAPGAAEQEKREPEEDTGDIEL